MKYGEHYIDTKLRPKPKMADSPRLWLREAAGRDRAGTFKYGEHYIDRNLRPMPKMAVERDGVFPSIVVRVVDSHYVFSLNMRSITKVITSYL